MPIPVTGLVNWCRMNPVVLSRRYLNSIWTEVLPEADQKIKHKVNGAAVLQVNGKLRGHLAVAATATKEEIEKAALASEAAVKFMEGRPARKVVVVPGRLVNIVA